MIFIPKTMKQVYSMQLFNYLKLSTQLYIDPKKKKIRKIGYIKLLYKPSKYNSDKIVKFIQILKKYTKQHKLYKNVDYDLFLQNLNLYQNDAVITLRYIHDGIRKSFTLSVASVSLDKYLTELDEKYGQEFSKCIKRLNFDDIIV